MLFAETQRDKIVGEHLLEKEFYSFGNNHAAFLGNVLKLSDPSSWWQTTYSYDSGFQV